MRTQYDSSAIEVLSGLDPVRKRPGMYTDTTRPNHLIQEVVDNSVDEAIAGFATRIEVVLSKNGAIEVNDNGRGMPVDRHPEQGVSGVEVVLTRLHAGGKFSNKNYRFSGGLHGVGISVVNALSERLEVEVKRNGKVYGMSFNAGEKTGSLAEIGTVGKSNTGSLVRFWPDAKYFDSNKISVSRLKHVLRAKAILCPNLYISLTDNLREAFYSWQFQDGLKEYLLSVLGEGERLPSELFTGSLEGGHEAVEWALAWVPEAGECIAESYVNLVPTVQGGTHVNGLRAGLTEAIREFCDFRKLLPRGVKIAPEDVWEKCIIMFLQCSHVDSKTISA